MLRNSSLRPRRAWAAALAFPFVLGTALAASSRTASPVAASANRSAAGCTGAPEEMAACSKLAWNGSRPWPSLVVPSGKTAITSPSRSASVM